MDEKLNINMASFTCTNLNMTLFLSVVENFVRLAIGSPKIDVESLILMIELILVSILFNLTRATLLSLRNHINITIYIIYNNKGID